MDNILTLSVGLLIPLLGTMLGSAFVFFMKDYLKDEEEDLYWSQGALDMIECIGVQNWLFTQV